MLIHTPRHRALALAAGAAAVAALAAGCSSSGGSASSSPSPSATSSAPANPAPATGAAASVRTGSSSLGRILVDGSGRTLYLFEADTGTVSTCNGACAIAWPPDLTTGKPTETGLTASMLGTSTRADHATQVTYDGHPLYYFDGDKAAGDVNGQGVTAFGGAWYVVSPQGSAITGSGAPSPSSTPSPTPSGNGGYGY
jgi:predicted lipoprotein with Yx(FWY)xxD motif